MKIDIIKWKNRIDDISNRLVIVVIIDMKFDDRNIYDKSNIYESLVLSYIRL